MFPPKYEVAAVSIGRKNGKVVRAVGDMDVGIPGPEPSTLMVVDAVCSMRDDTQAPRQVGLQHASIMHDSENRRLTAPYDPRDNSPFLRHTVMSTPPNATQRSRDPSPLSRHSSPHTTLTIGYGES